MESDLLYHFSVIKNYCTIIIQKDGFVKGKTGGELYEKGAEDL